MKQSSLSLSKEGICSSCKEKVEPNTWHEHKIPSWEKEFADKLMFEWGGVMRAKEKEIAAIKWVKELLATEKKALLQKAEKEIEKMTIQEDEFVMEVACGHRIDGVAPDMLDISKDLIEMQWHWLEKVEDKLKEMEKE